MKTVDLAVVMGIVVACGSPSGIVGPRASATDACPAMEIQGLYADSTNQGQAHGHAFFWETKNWEVIRAGELIDAQVRGEIDTEVVIDDGTAIPIAVTVLADVVNPFFVVCEFEDPLVLSEIVALDASSIQSVTGKVSGHFVEGLNPSVINGEYDIRIVLADGRVATHVDSWQAPIL